MNLCTAKGLCYYTVYNLQEVCGEKSLIFTGINQNVFNPKVVYALQLFSSRTSNEFRKRSSATKFHRPLHIAFNSALVLYHARYAT